MSNSAYISTEDKPLSIYLHWNGGLDSVIPFLRYVELQGYPSLEHSGAGYARLCQAIGNYMGGTCNIGLKAKAEAKPDHGTYLVKGWKVHKTTSNSFCDMDCLQEGIEHLDNRQPKHMKLRDALEDEQYVIPRNVDETLNDKLFKVIHPSRNLAICFDSDDDIDILVALVKYCEIQHHHPFHIDSYGCARFCQVVGNYIGPERTLFVKNIGYTENLGARTYMVRGWNPIPDVPHDEDKIKQLLKKIDAAQPEALQLGDFLDSVNVASTSLKIGDEVYKYHSSGKYRKAKVIGIGVAQTVNGTNVKGMPYIDLYSSGSDNINNYITTATAQKAV